MDTTLVVLAAGLGSRFGGNKQISHVGPHGEILMEYSIRDAIDAGFTQIVFILKEDMVDLIKNGIGARIAKHARVDYAVQSFASLPAWYKLPEGRQKPFGTVHAVLAAKDLIRGPFATVNADDYYGKEAFSMMHRMLTELSDVHHAAMIPYLLGNTMSLNGGVTRGVCSLENGVLKSICETHEIHYEGDQIVGEFGPLTGTESVSMNIWGFHRELLERMENYFHTFLRGLSPDADRAECLLPVMVSDLLECGELTVSARTSRDRWFGITYAADRDSVAEELETLHKAGAYPDRLF